MFFRYLKTGLGSSFFGSSQNKLLVTVTAAHFLSGHHRGRIPILNLSGNFYQIVRGVKMGDRPNATLTGYDGLPGLFYAMPQRTQYAHAGDNDSSAHLKLPFLKTHLQPENYILRMFVS